MKRIDIFAIILIGLLAVAMPIALVASHQHQQDNTIYAKDGDWSVKKIYAHVGDDLTIHVESQDVIHSFQMDAFNISVELYPGHVMSIHIPTDQAGTFMYKCFIYCSPHHTFMEGYIVIK